MIITESMELLSLILHFVVMFQDKDGRQISVEVAIMLKLAAGTTGSVGTSAPVSLLDWYDLNQELILVLERPVPSEDLHKYIEVNGGSLQEEDAKVCYWRFLVTYSHCSPPYYDHFHHHSLSYN